MGLDANGIWIYDESEAAAPVSAMLNRLADSVSDQIAPVVVPGPVAWTNTGLVGGAGITLSNAEYMVDRWGQVKFRGDIYGTAPAANAVIMTIPASIQPTARLTLGLWGIGGVATAYVGAYGGTGAFTELRYRNLVSGAWPTTSTVAMSLHGLRWSRV